MTAVNQKEYLKKYLSGSDSQKKKKKKKKKEKSTANRLQIVDEDAGSLQNIAYGYADYDDAPTVAEVTYDCAKTKFREEQKALGTKWKKTLENPASISVNTAAGDEDSRTTRYDSDASPPSQCSENVLKSPSASGSLPKRQRLASHGSPLRETSSMDVLRSSDSQRKGELDSTYSLPEREKLNLDGSPPSRGRLDSDKSPAINSRFNSNESAPQKGRSDSDESPQKKSRFDSDESPRRKSRFDSDESPQKKSRFDSDESPRRKNKFDSDESPRRKSRFDSDESPPRNSRLDSDESPPRKGVDSDESPPRKNIPLKCDSGREKQLTTAEYLLRRKKGMLKKDSAEEVARKLREESLQRAAEEKHKLWNKGITQVQQQHNRLADIQHEMTKSFARSEKDEDLNDMYKSKMLAEDPMLEYLTKKKEKTDGNKPQRPVYQGSFPPNRFNIRPGYRWDGVDRSNGFEQQYFAKLSNQAAIEEDAYRYCAEDM